MSSRSAALILKPPVGQAWSATPRDTRSLFHSAARGGEGLRVLVGNVPPLLKAGLWAVLAGVAETIDCEAAESEELLRERDADVLIVGESVEFGLLRRLSEAEHRVTNVLVLAHEPSLAFGSLLLAHGGSCVAQSVTAVELIDTVERVARGERVFVSVDGEDRVRRYPVGELRLTAREFEVLGHLGRGASHAQIAQALRISPRTVQNHTAAICRKLGVSAKRELIGLRVSEEIVSAD